ncbi:tetratricopeptide repeat protein [Lutimonas sp.]|uniref:tetratricopeptide repeat protein n=1 Tax=Lutimonas sp. TaxID=1872403 RepID=UPI003D9BCE9C
MKNLSFLILILLFACKDQKPKDSYLGIVNIDISGNEKAIPHFEKGLLLLHSFEYEDSRESFLKAQEEDPKLLMAYWGEAMTYNHSLWTEQDYDQGIRALEKLKEHQNNTDVSELEKDLISAITVLYRSDTVKVQRDENYAKKMASLYNKYPDNHEVAAFYALSLLGSVEDGRDEVIYGQGAKIAQGILDKNPKHPGALHYVIHSYDDPGHAELALAAADSYAIVAPDAGHALHMPSHIYMALGMWDQVVSSNENSFQASINRMNAKNLAPHGRGYHAFHWLEYGYLQQGRFEEAEKMVFDMEGFMTAAPNQYSKTHMVYLKGTYLVESNDWNSDVSAIEVDIEDLNVVTRSKYRFINGMKAYQKNDKEGLVAAINAIKKDHDKESYLVSYDDAPFCSGASRYNTSPSMLVRTEIMMYQLMAMNGWLENNPKETESFLKKSIELEENLSFSFGPPVVQKPTTELYADWLLAHGRTEEAAKQYKKTLDKTPKRSKSEKGLQICENKLSELAMTVN